MYVNCFFEFQWRLIFVSFRLLYFDTRIEDDAWKVGTGWSPKKINNLFLLQQLMQQHPIIHYQLKIPQSQRVQLVQKKTRTTTTTTTS